MTITSRKERSSTLCWDAARFLWGIMREFNPSTIQRRVDGVPLLEGEEPGYMRFNTQTTTTINPMIPRTNQIVRLISDLLLIYIHPVVGGRLAYVWRIPPAGYALRAYSGGAVGDG
jgi:hypothetical protein